MYIKLSYWIYPSEGSTSFITACRTEDTIWNYCVHCFFQLQSHKCVLYEAICITYVNEFRLDLTTSWTGRMTASFLKATLKTVAAAVAVGSGTVQIIWLITLLNNHMCSSTALRFLVLEFICQLKMISTLACASWANTVSLNVCLLSFLCCFMRRWPLKRQVSIYHICGRKTAMGKWGLNHPNDKNSCLKMCD